MLTAIIFAVLGAFGAFLFVHSRSKRAAKALPSSTDAEIRAPGVALDIQSVQVNQGGSVRIQTDGVDISLGGG